MTIESEHERIQRERTETEAQYIIKGYPVDWKVSEDGAVAYHREDNAYVYVDITGRLCIHGGDTGGCLYIDKKDQDCIGGDVAPGH